MKPFTHSSSKTVTVISSILLCLTSLGSAAPSASYQNPLVRGVSPDPSICRVGEDFRMKVEATPEAYIFSYAGNQSDWQPVGSGLTQLIATEVAAVGSGVLLGAYANGNGEACANPADADWFESKNINWYNEKLVS